MPLTWCTRLSEKAPQGRVMRWTSHRHTPENLPVQAVDVRPAHERGRNAGECCGARGRAGRAGRRLTCGPAAPARAGGSARRRSEEHTSELQSRENLVCRLLLEKKKHITTIFPLLRRISIR